MQLLDGAKMSHDVSQNRTLLETPQLVRKFSHGRPNLAVLMETLALALTALLIVT
jgi:hypothetical protein